MRDRVLRIILPQLFDFRLNCFFLHRPMLVRPLFLVALKIARTQWCASVCVHEKDLCFFGYRIHKESKQSVRSFFCLEASAAGTTQKKQKKKHTSEQSQWPLTKQSDKLTSNQCQWRVPLIIIFIFFYFFSFITVIVNSQINGKNRLISPSLGKSKHTNYYRAEWRRQSII